MRIILVTGLGGAGRTTVAVATALAEARAGRRVLLVSEDADVLPSEGGLRVLRPEPATDFRREFLALQARSATALDLLGASPFEEAELTELPGSRQFALLRSLRDAAEGGHELAVVDLPPLPEALAVLALPEQLRRYLRRLLPPERQAARALRPMLAQLAGVPMPAQWLYETTARWEAELAAVQAVVDAPTTSVRLVLEPGPAAVRALRAARLGLALQGLALDAVVANRLLPADSDDPWLAGLTTQQHRHLAELRAAGALVDELPHLGRDPRGPEDLALLAPARPAGPRRSTPVRG
uniref:ArsA family ATPase n=1 Tax=Streptomyces venezuelae TaxID=54571 RepID=UPI001F16D80F